MQELFISLRFILFYVRCVDGILLLTPALIFASVPEKYKYILTLETARTRNRHCANCIGTLLFPMAGAIIGAIKQRDQSQRLIARTCTRGSRRRDRS